MGFAESLMPGCFWMLDAEGWILDAGKMNVDRMGSSIFPEFFPSPYELTSDVLFLFQ